MRIVRGMTGWMSIGINLLTAPQSELEQLRAAVAEFKLRRAFTLFAFAHGMHAWNLAIPRLRMRGLIPDALYTCEDGRQMTGEALMHYGLPLRLKGDCDSHMERWSIL